MGFTGNTKNIRFVARTSGEQQYDDDGATVDTRVQLQILFGYTCFCCVCGKTAAAIHKNLVSVYGVQCMTEGVVRQWVEDFHAGRDKVHNLLQERRLKDSLMSDAITSVYNLLEEDRKLTIQQIEYAMHKEMGNPISRATVYCIVLKELNINKVSSRWVPKQLTDTHRNERTASAIDFLTQHKQEGNVMLELTVTGDETWVHHYTPSKKKQTMVWKSSDETASKKFKAAKSAKKVTCTVFWHFKGIIHEECLEPTKTDKTITAAHYCDTLMRLRMAIKQKQAGLLSCSVILLHNNARPQSATITHLLLEDFKCKWDVF